MLLIRKDSLILFSSSSFSGFSGFGYGYGWGLSSSPQFMQMGSFKLKNGMRINTYGDYDKDGWRVPNRSAMPWERNNFRGAFELKSAMVISEYESKCNKDETRLIK